MKPFWNDVAKGWFAYGFIATLVILLAGEVSLAGAVVTGVIGLVVALATEDW